MPASSRSPKKRAEVDDLGRAIRQAVEAEIGEPAADLADTDDALLFGDNEFEVRAIALRIAAKAYEQHPAREKTETTAPG